MNFDAIVILSVLVTSILSGFMGMGGGLIFMAILVGLLPVPTTMVLHGLVQLSANGSRALYFREHIQWQILGWYFLGTVLVGAVFLFFRFVPDRGLVYLLLGLFPFVSFLPQIGSRLSIQLPFRPAICGSAVTLAQLTAGASGGVLDIFYLHSSLNRFQVIGSKALTQSLGHFVKLLYYASVTGMVGLSTDISLWVFPVSVVTAVIGTYIGKQVLRFIDEVKFRKITKYFVAAIGVVLIVRGLSLLFFA